MSAKIEPKSPESLKEYVKEFNHIFSLIGWIWREIIPEVSKKWSRWMIFIHIISVAVATTGPFLIAVIVDNLPHQNSEGNARIVMWAFGGFVVLQVVHKLFEYVRRVLREYQLGENIKAIDHFITKMFLSKSLGQHIRERKHLSVANVEKGRNKMLNIQSIILFEAFDVLFRLLIAFVALCMLSPASASIVAGFMIPYLIWSVFVNSKVARVAYPIDKKFRTLNRYRHDRWKNSKRVKLACMDEEENEHMSSEFDNILKEDRHFWIWFIRHITYRDVLIVGAFVLVIGYGIYSVFNGGGVGSFTVGLMYPLIMWTTRIVENIWQVGELEHQFSYNTPAVQALREVSNLKPDIVNVPGAKVLSRKPVRIEFRNVWFRHKGSVLEPDESQGEHPYALRNVSFVIEAGEKVGCIGPSGAGKSTITALLLRAFDPDKGEILIDGTNLKDINLESWWSLIGYIPQRPAVFDGTLSDNLLYGHGTSVSKPRLLEVVNRLQIDFGHRLVNGLNTTVGEDGIELSGGEQQRLMAGSAVMDNPLFMIIDEATSSLDSTTEKVFQQGLEQMLSGESGAFAIAHRLSTIRNCDKIIVLKPSDQLSGDQSQVEAVGGNFSELHEISPTFRQLAQDQDLRI